jgi:hypothetical protein
LFLDHPIYKEVTDKREENAGEEECNVHVLLTGKPHINSLLAFEPKLGAVTSNYDDSAGKIDKTAIRDSTVERYNNLPDVEFEKNQKNAGFSSRALYTEVVAADFVFSKQRTSEAHASLHLRFIFTLVNRAKQSARLLYV